MAHRSRAEGDTMSAVNVFRVRAALGRPRKEAALLAFVLLVVQKMTNNPSFTSPGTVVTALGAAAAAFQTALANMSTFKDLTDARTAAKQAVVDRLLQVQAYINGVVATLPPDLATAAVESTGLATKKRSTRTKPPLEIKYGGLPGSVVAVALAAAKSAVYYFEYSSDQKTWLACPIVMKAKTFLSGLTIGTIYYFRVHAQTRKGLTELSSVVSFVVR
jgi:hypothetical protein